MSPMKDGLHGIISLGLMAAAVVVADVSSFPRFGCVAEWGEFIGFWVITGTALIQIRGVVCGSCNNVYCPGNRAAEK